MSRKWKGSEQVENVRSLALSSYLLNYLLTAPWMVSMLASGTQDRGFAPGRSRRIFSGEKILSMPSFVREVKPFALCRRFAACQRTL
jgi:hypothetical protein